MTLPPEKSSGSVCLVGAGPGDPGLITVAGLQRLRCADVVVYDALASAALLDEAPAHAIRVNAGKRAGNHHLSQDRINDLLVEHARAGRRVVRLKGGDPYLFGRGAEEVVHCARHGVTCEVIAGVTSGIAAPMAAGIPVTYRHLASTVTFVTGHEGPDKAEPVLDYAALVALIRGGGTVCFYMAMARLSSITAAFIAGGLAESTPVAVVQWGTTPEQRALRSTLAHVAAEVAAAALTSPAIVVIGPVAAIDEPGLRFFESRPLWGQRIVVTRTRTQSVELRQQLEAAGAQVLDAPTIQIALSPPASDLDVSRYQWLIMTSGHAVHWLASCVDARKLAGPRIAVVGQATADTLWDRLRIRPDVVPEVFTGEALARDLIGRCGMAGQRCLLLRGTQANPALPTILRDAGATVDNRVVYDITRPDVLPEPVLTALRERRIDWVTLTSSSTANNLVEMLGDERSLLRHVRIASIGPTTSAALQALNLPVTVEAATAGVEGLVAAIATYRQTSIR